jgi:hypothetical protein
MSVRVTKFRRRMPILHKVWCNPKILCLFTQFVMRKRALSGVSIESVP